MLSFLFVFQGDSASKAYAANGADFNPGNIISDAVFFDGTALSAGQIQSFLESQVPNCRAGYTCLKDYRQSTPTRAAVTGLCSQYTGAANELASEIIAKVGQTCGISQKVLLVLLQKEQILVTDDWPVDVQYRSATGYGCPDTAACDTQYYGFFNQVYNAAKQFKNYAANPNGWNYVAGRVNTVLFNPNRACGTSDIYIANQATAGLYIYTPYQPNGAALANLYGYGDSCSAYGNRNFWRIFTDWFGNPSSTSLVRTIENARVYLLANGSKYLISSLALLSEFNSLGRVSFVSQSYLDGIPAAQPANRIVRLNSGGIYYLDAGSKYHFTSCETVAAFGGSCASSGYVQLDDVQGDSFRTASDITQIIQNTSGFRYYVNAGTKAEIINSMAQNSAGLGNIQTTVLSNSALNELQWTSYIGPSDIFVKSPSSPSVYYVSNAGWRLVTSWEVVVAISNNSNPNVYLVSDELMSNAPKGIPISSPLLAGVTLSGNWAPGSFVKSKNSPTIFQVSTNQLKPANSWAALVAAAGTSSPTVYSVSSDLILASPMGQALPEPSIPEPTPSTNGAGQSGWQVGSFVKTSSSPSVYFVTSTNIRLISNWDVLVAVANNPRPSISIVSTSAIDSMIKGPVLTSPLGSGASLSGVWAQGKFLKSQVSPIVYQIDNSELHPVRSWNVLVRLAGSNNPIINVVAPVLIDGSIIGNTIN